MSLKVMLWDDWEDEYIPIENHIDDNASFDGCMYETFGEELRHVQSINNTDPGKVWTLIDNDGVVIVTNGFHHVNRFGYLITEKYANPKFDVYEIRD